MKRTQLFTRTLKEAPSDEVAKNAQLLIRAGYIHKVMAGVYAFTPLGIRVLENIKQIVREEMNSIGGQELIMSSLQRQETWDSTGRWDDEVVDVWFKTKLKDHTELGLAWSHEEAIIEMMKQHVVSYKDVPSYVYQFQTKFRNELRSKSGIMRGREFVMKDMYSISTDSDSHEKFYQECIEAYNRVFERLGIGSDTYVTFAAGGAFTQFSHEFQTVCEAGEDIIYVDQKKGIAVNEEVMSDDNLSQFGVSKDDLVKVKSAEVGNIFNFGTQKSEETDFAFTNEKGEKQFVHLGSYGIGITRVMGVIAEKMSDENGLSWPDNIAPYKVYLVAIGGVSTQAEKLYEDLQLAGVEVLYDDRDSRPGEKFADAELMGIPHRIVISGRTLESDSVEHKGRMDDEASTIKLTDIIEKLVGHRGSTDKS
ncbi:MAG: prolyl-tRNA synthetase [Candidatus Saccharimonadales bacterium]|jgi:prolyl-tRNA synthetase